MACNIKSLSLNHQIVSNTRHLNVDRKMGAASNVSVPVFPDTVTKNLLESTNLSIKNHQSTEKLLMKTVDRKDVNSRGKFGRFGGKYVPETLMACLGKLEAEFNLVLHDSEFQVYD